MVSCSWGAGTQIPPLQNTVWTVLGSEVTAWQMLICTGFMETSETEAEVRFCVEHSLCQERVPLSDKWLLGSLLIVNPGKFLQ